MAIGITGAKGFIGSHLSSHIVATQPSAVRLFARNMSNYRCPAGAQVFQGDLLSRSDCERFADDLHLIYYLAHNNTPVNSDLDLPSDVLVNLVPLLNLLQAIQKLGTKPHVVYFSSGGAVYAPKQDQVPYRESDPCGPGSSYGIQKLAAEEYLRLAARKHYLTATILRVANAYGTPLSHFRMQGLIGVAVNCVAQGRPVRVFGNPNNVRDYVHLEDLTEMAVRGSVPNQPFSIVNVGSGVGHSVLDILRVIEELWGKPIDIRSDQSLGNWLTDWVVLDNGKAREEFGWSPAVDLRSGIAGMLDGLTQRS
jgi:UDP-glucose 4-epimerase